MSWATCDAPSPANKLRASFSTSASRRPSVLSPGRFSRTLPVQLPLLKVLGYGTGVHVSLLERSSPGRGVDGGGTYRSPWAVKHVRSRATGDGAVGCSPRLRSSAAQRLRDEAELLRQLSHPCVVGYRGAQVSRGTDNVSLLMEAAQCCLMQLIERQAEQDVSRPMSLRQIAVVGADIGAALHYLHRQCRLLHGDVKSANVLVFDHFERVKLCDFGVCVRLDERLTADVDLYVGTQMWAPPEVVDVDRDDGVTRLTDRADVFAYALTLWEMFALEMPHTSDIDQMSAHTTDFLSEQEEMHERNEDVEDLSFTEILLQPPAVPVYADDVMQQYSVFIQLYTACVSVDPARRPAADQCASVFEQVRQQHRQKSV